MHILVISDLYPPYYIGGYELNCKDTVNALINRGNHVTVLTSYWGLKEPSVEGDVFRVLNYDDASFENQAKKTTGRWSLFEKRVLKIQRIFISKKNYTLTQRIIKQIRPEVIFFWHIINTTTSTVSCALDMGLPFVCRIEDYSLAQLKIQLNRKDHSIKDRYGSLILKMAECTRFEKHHLIVNSQSVKDYYLQATFLESSIDVLPDGLPSRLLHHPSNRLNPSFANPAGLVSLCFVGRINPDKGPDVAIKTIALLKKEPSIPPVHLDLIGTGLPEYVNYLKQLAVSLDLEDSVTFLGKLDLEEVLHRYQYYDAILFTSRWQEPFSRVVLEAMAQGLPVIGTDYGGTPEIICDHKNGLLVPVDDPQAIANAVKSLFTSPDLASQISVNAYETIRSRYTIEQVAAHIESFLANSIENKKPVPSINKIY